MKTQSVTHGYSDKSSTWPYCLISTRWFFICGWVLPVSLMSIAKYSSCSSNRKLISYHFFKNNFFILQKVEYRGRDAQTKTEYTSITRSCSQGTCIPHVDNCTDDLLSNPGCMTRRCCNDKNLCNGAQHITRTPLPCWLVATVLTLFVLSGGSHCIATARDLLEDG